MFKIYIWPFKNRSGLQYKIFTHVALFFDKLQHKLQGLCLLTQLIPSSYSQRNSQIHNTEHLIGETSAECAQFTMTETMQNTATMLWKTHIPCYSRILCDIHSLYNKCIFAENWTWLCTKTIKITHANDLRAYWQCSINITIVQTPMMTVRGHVPVFSSVLRRWRFFMPFSE